MSRTDPRIRAPRDAGTAWERRLQLAFNRLAFMSGADYPERADDEAVLAQGKPERAKPVQREGTEQEALTRMARTRWWWPGYRHHEQARPTSDRERARLRARGVAPGWPDVTVHVPRHFVAERPGFPLWKRSGEQLCDDHKWRAFMDSTRIALELKAPERRPTRTDEAIEWWLAWNPASPQATRYGLQATQAQTLQLLASVGYLTRVAYGADEALEWLDEVIGPEPSEPVAWPVVGEVDDWADS